MILFGTIVPFSFHYLKISQNCFHFLSPPASFLFVKKYLFLFFQRRESLFSVDPPRSNNWRIQISAQLNNLSSIHPSIHSFIYPTPIHLSSPASIHHPSIHLSIYHYHPSIHLLIHPLIHPSVQHVFMSQLPLGPQTGVA